MRRGQAFDTMMLVISVIVAVAILGLLLSFLGNINIFGADAKSNIATLVKSVQGKGFGLELKENVQFDKGNSIYARDAIGSAPIATSDVVFICVSGDSSCTGNNPPVTVDTSPASIVGNQKISLTVAVCYGEDNAPSNYRGKYVVVIGKTTKGVRDYAATQCGLG